jgi:hypothetical protein
MLDQKEQRVLTAKLLSRGGRERMTGKPGGPLSSIRPTRPVPARLPL